MEEPLKLNEMLAQVVFRTDYHAFTGLDPIRNLLLSDGNEDVVIFLEEELPRTKGKKRYGVAFLLAERFFRTDDLLRLRNLLAIHDPEIQEGALDALRGEPPAGSAMGPGVVQLAINACDSPWPGVRAEACSVLIQMCGWEVDGSAAKEPLYRLLEDTHARVLQVAAGAIGRMGERGYCMSRHIAQLRRNLKHDDIYVREESAWALWKLCSHKHDLSGAVRDLAEILGSSEEYAGVRKNAAGALLNHARKSVENAAAVRECLERTLAGCGRKELQKLRLYLADQQ